MSTTTEITDTVPSLIAAEEVKFRAALHQSDESWELARKFISKSLP